MNKLEKIIEIIKQELQIFYSQPLSILDSIVPLDVPAYLKNIQEYNERIIFMQGWFLRCSWQMKLYILKQLVESMDNIFSIILILNTIYSAICKDYIYSAIQGLNLFNPDIILIDDNRMLDITILNEIVIKELKWFNNLNGTEQYSLIMDLIQLSDSSIIGKAFSEFLVILKKKLRVQIIAKLAAEQLNAPQEDTKTSKKDKKKDKKAEKAPKDKKGKKRKTSAVEENSEEKLLVEILSFLNQNLLDNPKDSLNMELNSLNQKWTAFITAYKKRTGGDEAEVSSKKKPKKKKEKTNKDLIDEVQLLPVWISKNILASLDTKSLNATKKVNKYWSFAAKGIKQDMKCRQALNKTCNKLKENLSLVKIPIIKAEITIPNFCNTTNTQLRQKCISKETTSATFLTDLLYSSENLSSKSTNVKSFPRFRFSTEIFVKPQNI